MINTNNCTLLCVTQSELLTALLGEQQINKVTYQSKPSQFNQTSKQVASYCLLFIAVDELLHIQNTVSGILIHVHAFNKQFFMKVANDRDYLP
jgi:transcriptional regulator with AAA-type ATPase domain